LGSLQKLPKEIRVKGLEGWASFMLETLYEIAAVIVVLKGKN